MRKMQELFCLGKILRRRITRDIYTEVSCNSLMPTKLVQRENTCNNRHSLCLVHKWDCDATHAIYAEVSCTSSMPTKLVTKYFYHMTRTAPRAISLENHQERCRMRAVRVEVMGPEKRVRPY